MIKTILVPIDVAAKEAGAAALGMARELAEKHGGKITLLYVLAQVPGYVETRLPMGFREKILADATASLNEIAAKGGLAKTAEVVVREGHPPTEILEFANERGVDMIVVASHNPGGVVDFLLGSVAARVVRHAHCSVLVVRGKR